VHSKYFFIADLLATNSAQISHVSDIIAHPYLALSTPKG
jgi:hypothetical protein